MRLDPGGLRARARALAALRSWFADRGYLEVPTPVLVPSPALEEHLYAVPAAEGALRTSPEFALKKVLAAGLGRIYEIGPCLRDRERGPWHAREFTMCEWYRVGATIPDAIDECESLIGAVARALDRPDPGPWRRVTVRTLFREMCGLDLAVASARDLSPAVDEPWDDAFTRRWVSDIEPLLTGAVVVSDWPASQGALARVVRRNGHEWAARFELYLNGIELANAFDELLDGAELRSRFHRSNARRAAAGEAPHPVDEALIAAVDRMPPTVGVALGVDRLVAAVLGWSGIAPGRVDTENATR